MAGAVLNEELRILAPISPSPLETRGAFFQVTPSSSLSPRPSTVTHTCGPQPPLQTITPPAYPPGKCQSDLEDFKSDRWILDTKAKRAAAKEMYKSVAIGVNNDKAAVLGVSLHADTAAGLYKPPKSAYIPFSEGYRSCVGRRFAQVELMAELAVIFSQHSEELAVDEWATDEELETMDGRGKRRVWDKAREKVEKQLRDDMGKCHYNVVKGSIGKGL